MQRRRNPARNQKPEPQPPAKESPAPAKDNAKDKRKQTPVKEKTAETPPAPPPPPPLPIKLTPGLPIPTVKEPQPADLPDADWQSVLESGVLKAALERSRQKWMTPGIFELYYSKAGKKKLPNKQQQQQQQEGKDKENQKEGGGDQESLKAKQMKREGNCKLYIDPHQWDITIWTMRENTAPPPPKPKPAPQPSYNNQGYYYGGYGATHPYQHYHPYPHQHPPHQPPPPIHKPPPPAPPSQPPPSQTPAHDSNASQSKPAPDPVIHMLAERANTNFKLRDIMKIVARGDATKEQLEYFQSHINELTERLEAQKKAQQAHRPPAPPSAPPPPAPTPAQAAVRPATPASPATPAGPTASTAPPRPPSASTSPAVGGTPAARPPSSALGTPGPTKMPPQPPMTYYTPPAQTGPYGHYHPPHPPPTPVQAPPPPQPPQPSYRALCIDFNTNGDRLLFPRETILEPLPGNQVLASFLKVQKVDHLTMTNLPKTQTYYKTLKEYYQPITVRFRADNPNTLQCLFRWVKPQEEVRKHMDEIMDKCEPAEDVELAARLPREGANIEGQNGGPVRDSVERVGTPMEGRDKKRVKRVK